MITNDNTIKPRGDISMSLDPGILLRDAETLKQGTPGFTILESARQAMTVMHKETALQIDRLLSYNTLLTELPCPFRFGLPQAS